jgi:hypothetical protein
MKLVNVFLGILFVTSTLQAQIPLYPYLYTQPYVYTQPYYQGPYMQWPYGAFDQVSTFYADQINQLAHQVDELRFEVVQLEGELAEMRAQAPQAPPSEITRSEPDPPASPVVLIFDNGKRIESKGYLISGETLWFFGGSDFQSIPLSALDVDATQHENLKRGVSFLAPEKET